MHVVVFCLWMLASAKIIKDSVLRMDAASNKIFEAFAYYNPLIMVAMMMWLWGVNVFVFLRSRVSYAKVFDLDHNHLTHREIWKMSAWLTVTVVTSLSAYLYLESYNEFHLAASQPVLLYCFLPLLLAIPLNVLYSPSRFYFLTTVFRMILPLKPISFADFFVADVLTSMSKVLSDLERAVCKMYYHEDQRVGILDDDAKAMCGNTSYRIPCILAFPYLCRFFQCLRQYSYTRDKSCLFNALKYSTTFPVIILSAMKYHLTDDLWQSRYRPLWLFWSVINMCYSFYWDISRDWDFGFLSSCKSRRPFLRPSLLYNRRWVYYWAILSNLGLRCSWTYKLSAHLRHNRLTVFTFSALEMLRRFQWIFFRVESEYNKMITRAAAPPVPLKEIDGESERLLSPSSYDV